jgi:chemotaxis protein methyltransferase CheR
VVLATQPALDRRTFKQIAAFIYDRAGILLSDQKETLVAARVGKRMRKLGMDDYAAYLSRVQNDKSGDELVELLNAISTNTTHFFRESRHFDVLTGLLQQWEAEGQSRFRIWCAAASTGEEPYTIAMTLREAIPAVSDVKLLATDISTKVLARAREGVYSAKSVEAVPRELRLRHFVKEGRGEGAAFRVTPELRRIVKFGRINLAKPPFPLRGPLDVIFCRNVMIYFDNKVRAGLLNDMARLLRPGGVLFVGHAESLSGQLCPLVPIEPSVYIKN